MHIIQHLALAGSSCGWKACAEELRQTCPLEFKTENEWSRAAAKLFGSSDPSKWHWKAADKTIQRDNYLIILAIIASFWLWREEKVAIVGWILSEMLHTPP